MKTFYLTVAALLATTAGAANAASSIGLSTNYSLEYLVGISTSEASGVTYDWDNKLLYVVSDGGNWDPYSTATGHFDHNLPPLSTFKDPEGIAYIGNNTFVIAQERTMEMNKASGTDVTFENASPTFCVAGCANIGNIGLEGVSYDSTTGDFYGVKETNSQKVWKMTGVDFAGNGTVSELFDASLLGLQTLSDIQVLSNSDAFAGTPFADNLLILSATSEKLLEVTKTGEILSMLDLHNIGVGKIEGVTVDDEGNLYLVGEQGPMLPGTGITQSGLIKLTRNVAAVPEPATWAMMLGGLSLVGGAMRRRKVVVSFA